MKAFFLTTLSFLLVFAGVTDVSAQEKENNWTAEQLKAPEQLATEILSGEEAPLILDIGPSGHILGSTMIGPAENKENIQKLKRILKDAPRDKEVVIYCGCCPFNHCPNVRPAFQALLDMGFTQPKLLNLSHNLKVDWIDKGFPLEKE